MGTFQTIKRQTPAHLSPHLKDWKAGEGLISLDCSKMPVNLHGVRAAHGTLNPLVRVRISVEVYVFIVSHADRQNYYQYYLNTSNLLN